MMSRLSSLLLAAALSALAGCAADLPGSPGQLGTVRFEYATPGVCAACAVDREVLAGSVLDIEMYGLNVKTAYQVRSSAPDIADFQATTRCRFLGEENCKYGVAVFTKKAGDADLEVYDEWTGTVLDRVTVRVRDAAWLETTVKAEGPGSADLAPAPDGVFELKVDSNLAIVSTAHGASGSELIATSAAINSAYRDVDVVGPRPDYADASPTEYAKAKSPGTAIVAIAGAGARQELRFRVAP